MGFDFFSIIKRFKKLKVLFIGEGIIDEYCYVQPRGTASKDPIISTQFLRKEKYLGGVFAPARHLSNFVNKVHVISVLGDYKSNEGFIMKEFEKRGISTSFFTKKNSPTIIKRRYIEHNHLRKLFKMEFNNQDEIDTNLEKKIIENIETIKDQFDLIIVNDFGHGLFSKKLISYLCGLDQYVAVNVQTNSSNFGFNPATKYNHINFLSLNEMELRIIFQKKNLGYQEMLKKLYKEYDYQSIFLTLGKKGSYYLNDDLFYSDSFVANPVDTVGAGDAVFSFVLILDFLGIEKQSVPVFGNIVGACAVESVGNQLAIDSHILKQYFERYIKEGDLNQRERLF